MIRLTAGADDEAGVVELDRMPWLLPAQPAPSSAVTATGAMARGTFHTQVSLALGSRDVPYQLAEHATLARPRPPRWVAQSALSPCDLLESPAERRRLPAVAADLRTSPN